MCSSRMMGVCLPRRPLWLGRTGVAVEPPREAESCDGATVGATVLTPPPTVREPMSTATSYPLLAPTHLEKP